MDLRSMRNVPDLARILRSKKVSLSAGQVVLVTTEGLYDRQLIIIRNIGKDTVYLGDTDVSTDNGFPLYVNEVIVLPTKKEIFAISEKDGELRVLEG